MGLLKNLFTSLSTKRVALGKRFRLHHGVGAGSMSKVWRATDLQSGRGVCVKVLDKAQLALLTKRFVGLKKPSEGEISVQLHHPNVVRTFEHGITTRNEEFLVMEYIDGVGLILMIETKSPQLQGRELDILIQAGEGLAHFHEMGFIHRDVCPHNVMVTAEGQAKLIDFGLAVPDAPLFRRPGNRTGKIQYMAPELLARRPTDQRIDVFGFGVLAYQTFTGDLPWTFSSTQVEVGQTGLIADAGKMRNVAALMRHLQEPPRDPRTVNPDIDEETALVLIKAMERDPQARYQSMRELVAALQRLRGDDAETSRQESREE